MAPNDKNLMSKDDKNNLPKWLNEEFFNDVLKQKFQNYKIIKFSPKPALQAGENYASDMFRVLIEIELENGEKQTESFIVKHVEEKADGFDLVKELKLFQKEKQMYDKIIREFEKLYQDVGQNVEFSPKCFKMLEKPQVLVMEDLKTKQFVNVNRQKGFDMIHTEAVLTKLAQFHAASARYYEKYRSYPEIFYEGIYNDRLRDIFKDVHEKSSDIFHDCMLKWKHGHKYADKFHALREKYFDKIYDSLDFDPNEFNVLNHGDIWCNNIMFQYNETGDIKEVYFVDLQICKWGTLTQDLHYFIISSISHDIKVNNYEYFVKYYHDRLIENLKILQYQGEYPKLLDLHCQMLRRGFFGVAASLGVLTAVLLDPTDDACLDNYLDSDEKGKKFKEKVYSNPLYVEVMEKLLPFFDNRGLLD